MAVTSALRSHQPQHGLDVLRQVQSWPAVGRTHANPWIIVNLNGKWTRDVEWFRQARHSPRASSEGGPHQKAPSKTSAPSRARPTEDGHVSGTRLQAHRQRAHQHRAGPLAVARRDAHRFAGAGRSAQEALGWTFPSSRNRSPAGCLPHPAAAPRPPLLPFSLAPIHPGPADHLQPTGYRRDGQGADFERIEWAKSATHAATTEALAATWPSRFSNGWRRALSRCLGRNHMSPLTDLSLPLVLMSYSARAGDT